jgi:addiction module HigA family antidote
VFAEPKVRADRVVEHVYSILKDFSMPKTTQTPVSVLQSLMDEYRLNPFSLSKAIGLSSSAVRQIVNGKAKVSVATALRLAKYFGQTPVFWLDLQREADLSGAGKDKELQAALAGISKAKKPDLKAKAPAKPAKKPALPGKRGKTAKAPAPAAKRARGRPAKK